MAGMNALGHIRKQSFRRVRNTAKSVGMLAIDDVIGNNKTIVSLYRESQAVANSLKRTIGSRSNRPRYNALTGQMSAKKEVSAIEQTKRNLISDIRSGKIYNKQRIQEYDSIGDFDTDFNFGFDPDDFGDYDSEGGSTGASAQSSAKLSAAINGMGARTSSAISEATIASADYIVNSTKTFNQSMMQVTLDGFDRTLQGLLVINDNLSQLTALARPLNDHMINTSRYYADSLEYQRKSMELLEQIAANTAPASPTGTRYKGPKNQLASILGKNGILNTSAYRNMVKGNVKDLWAYTIAPLLGINPDAGGGGKGFASPISSLVQMMMYITNTSFIPRNTRSAMGNMDKNLQGLFGTMFVRARGHQFTREKYGVFAPLLNGLKDILLPQDGFKKTINTGNYNKGKVDWDGISRKALIDVIPTQLGKIVAALTGEEEKRFDYNTGKWVTISAARKARDDKWKREVRDAGGDFITLMNQTALTSNTSAATKNQLMRDISRYNERAFDNNGDITYIRVISPGYRPNSKDMRTLGFNNMRDFKNFIDMAHHVYGTNAGKTAITRFGGQIQQARDKYGSNRRDEEALGDTMSTMFYNGSIDDRHNSAGSRRLRKSLQHGNGGLINQVDEYGHSMFFYLQGIWQATQHVSQNLEYLIPSGEGDVRLRGVSLNIKSLPAIPEVRVRGERQQRSASNRSGAERLNARSFGDFDASFTAGMTPEVQQYYETLIGLSGPDKNKFIRNNSELHREFVNYQKRYKSDTPNALSPNPKTRGGQWLFNTGAMKKAIEWINKGAMALNNADKRVARAIDGINSGVSNLALYSADSVKQAFADFSDTVSTMASKAGEHLKSAFTSVADRIFSFIPGWMKDFFSGLAKSISEGPVGDSLRKAGGWLFNFHKGGQQARQDMQAFNGRRVTRTGLVAVSEGELIIPSEYNPFYTGTSNKRRQQLREAEAIDTFYGSYAKGGTVQGGRKKNRGKKIKNAAKAVGSTIKLKANEGIGAMSGIIHEVADRVTERIMPEEEFDVEKKKVTQLISGALKDFGVSKGGIGAGALIGGGVSLLTGAIIGPIAAAGIGAAAGLVINSKKVQAALFGEDVVNEEGEVIDHKRGILPKKLSEFMQKNVPSMARGTGLGGIAGLFFGSPLIGAVVGGSLGFVNSSDSAKNFLFGDMDEEGNRKGGVISKKTQDFFKKHAPKAAAGAALGLLAGPFGLFGNLMIGSALGFATATDKFKNWFFGKDDGKGNRSGGIVDIVKKDLLNPIVNIFNVLGNRIFQSVRNIGLNLATSIKSALVDVAGKRLKETRIGSGLLKVGRGLGKAAWGAVTKPIQAINRGLTRSSLRKGYAISGMTAQDRLNAGSSNAIDELIAGTGDVNDLINLRAALAGTINPSSAADKAIMDYKVQMGNTFNEMISGKGSMRDRNAYTSIYNAIINGDFKGNVEDIIAKNTRRGISMSEEDRQKFIAMANQQRSNYNLRNVNNAQANANLENIIRKSGLSAEQQRAVLARLGKASGRRNALDQLDIDLNSKNTSLADKIANNEGTFRTTIVGKMDRIIRALEGKRSSGESVSVNTTDAEGGLTSAVGGMFESGDNPDTNGIGEDETTRDQYGNKQENLGSNIVKAREKRKSIILGGLDAIKSKLAPGIANVAGILGNISKGLFGDKEKNKEGILSKIMGWVKGGFTSIFDFVSGKVTKGLLKNFSMEKALSTVGPLIADGLGIAAIIAVLTGGLNKLLGKLGFGLPKLGKETSTTNIDNKTGSVASSGTSGATSQDNLFLNTATTGRYGDSRGELFFNWKTGDWTHKDGSIADPYIQVQESNATMTPANRFLYNHLVQASRYNPTIIGSVAKKTGRDLGRFGNAVKNSRLGQRFSAGKASRAAARASARNWFSGTGIGKSLQRVSASRAADAAADAAANRAGQWANFVANRAESAASNKTVTELAAKQAVKLANQADDAARAAVNMAEDLTKAEMILKKVFDGLSNVKILKGCKEGLDSVFNALKGKIAKLGASALGQALKTAFLIYQIAVIPWWFHEGFEDAKATLKILDEPTVGQRVLCGFIRAINNAIPLIGGLIPDSWFVDIVVNYIGPFLGFDMSDFKEQRARAQETVEAYNEKYGTNLSFQEYNKTIAKNYTTGEKIWNATKGYFVNGFRVVTGRAYKSYLKEGERHQQDLEKALDQYNLEHGTGLTAEQASKDESVMAWCEAQVAVNTYNRNNDANYTADQYMQDENVRKVVDKKSVGEVIVNSINRQTDVAVQLGKAFMNNPKAVFKGVKENFSKQVSKFANSKVGKVGKFIGGASMFAAGSLNGFNTIASGAKAAYNLLTEFSDEIISWFNKAGEWLKSNSERKEESFKETKDLIKNGDFGALLRVDPSTYNTDNPMSWIFVARKFVERVHMLPLAVVSVAGDKVNDLADKLTAYIEQSRAKQAHVESQIAKAAESGNLSEIWSTEVTDEEGNPLSPLYKTGEIFSKVAYSVPAVVNLAWNGIKKVVGNPKEAASELSTMIDQMAQRAEEGDVIGVWKARDVGLSSSHGILGKVFTYLGGFTRTAYTFLALIKKISVPVGNLVNWLKTNVGGWWQDNVTENARRATNQFRTGTQNLKEMALSGIETFTGNAGNMLNNAVNAYVGSGSGINQFSGQYSGMRVGGRSFADNGCGPATATMALGSMGRNVSMRDAVGVANQYQTTGGTDAGYFGDMFARNGVRANYQTSKAGIIRSIASGRPTILMGQDGGNSRSRGGKNISPFGPTNHYVVANGFDRNGNVIIRDPEGGTTRHYNSGILNQVRLGIGAGGASQEIVENYNNAQALAANPTIKNAEDYQRWQSNRDEATRQQGILNSYANNQNINSAEDVQSMQAARNTLGLSGPTTRGGVGGEVDTSHPLYSPNAAAAWGFLTSNDYSEAATAGILGNMQAESGVNPAAIQGGGRGPAAGIIQWENYNKKAARWKELYDYATSRGKDWTDLDTQLNFLHNEIHGSQLWAFKEPKYQEGLPRTISSPEEYKSLDDPREASTLFEKIFERGGKPVLEKRANYAQQFYELFTGSKYTGNYQPVDGAGVSSGANGDDESGGTGEGGLTGMGGTTGSKPPKGLAGILAAFSKGLNILFNGKEEEGTSSGGMMGEEIGGDISGSAGDGVYGSYSEYGEGADWETAHNITNGPISEKQLALVDKMRSIEGRLKYSMSGPRNPDKGSADCSSTVNWAYKNVLGSNIGGTTDAIMKSGALTTIDKSDLPREGGTGSGPNLDRLMPGDVVLLSRPQYDWSSGRPYRVGHVEMYMGDGMTIGHGSNNGPKVRNIESDKYIMARRFNDFITASPEEVQAGITKSYAFNQNIHSAEDVQNMQQARKDMGIYENSGPAVGGINYDTDPRFGASGSGIYRASKAGNRLLHDASRRYYSAGSSGMQGIQNAFSSSLGAATSLGKTTPYTAKDRIVHAAGNVRNILSSGHVDGVTNGERLLAQAVASLADIVKGIYENNVDIKASAEKVVEILGNFESNRGTPSSNVHNIVNNRSDQQIINSLSDLRNACEQLLIS